MDRCACSRWRLSRRRFYFRRGERTPVSWYLYLKRATRADAYQCHTACWGRAIGTLICITTRRCWSCSPYFVGHSDLPGDYTMGRRAYPAKLPLKLFLTFFAVSNLFLMLLFLANSLGQSPFWLPPVLAAFTCWIDWSFPRDRKLAVATFALVGICVLLLVFQQVEQSASVFLTWNRRSAGDLRRLSMQLYRRGRRCTVPSEGTSTRSSCPVVSTCTPMSRRPRASIRSGGMPIGRKLDARYVPGPTYAIWPKPDGVYPVEGGAHA